MSSHLSLENLFGNSFQKVPLYFWEGQYQRKWMQSPLKSHLLHPYYMKFLQIRWYEEYLLCLFIQILHFYIVQENGHSSMYTWILSTGWWESRAPVNPDAVIVIGFLCTSLICGFIYINRFWFTFTAHKFFSSSFQGWYSFDIFGVPNSIFGLSFGNGKENEGEIKTCTHAFCLESNKDNEKFFSFS